MFKVLKKVGTKVKKGLVHQNISKYTLRYFKYRYRSLFVRSKFLFEKFEVCYQSRFNKNKLETIFMTILAKTMLKRYNVTKWRPSDVVVVQLFEVNVVTDADQNVECPFVFNSSHSKKMVRFVNGSLFL